MSDVINRGLIKFIESYLNRDKEYSTTIFKVSEEDIPKGEGFWIRDINRHVFNTIALDNEDLKYLFDKYYPFYATEKEKQEREQEEYKNKQIKELEEKLEKLKNERHS